MVQQGAADARPAEGDGVRDIRTARAKAVWEALSRLVRTVIPFDQYLSQIPPIPDFPEEALKRLPCTVLVDPRFGVKDVCRLAEIYFAGNDASFAHSKSRRDETKAPFWTRMSTDIGYSKQVQHVALSESQAHATAVEGGFFLLQYPQFLKLQVRTPMLISGGSIWPNQPSRPAYFKLWRYSRHGGNPTGNAAVMSELALHQSSRGMSTEKIPKLVRFM